MTRIEQKFARKPAFPVIRPASPLAQLLLLNRAFREYIRLQRLDAAALRDMGLTEADRRSVTLAGIAARMRNRA